jgi:hypothetical protein
MVRASFALMLLTLLSGADTVTMIGENDIGCPDKASVVSAMKKPLYWTQTSNGVAYIPYADQFDAMRIFDPQLREHEKCHYLGSFLGAEFVRSSRLPAFVAPVAARIADRDGDLVCLQRPDAPPTTTCLWASASPPSKSFDGVGP